MKRRLISMSWFSYFARLFLATGAGASYQRHDWFWLAVSLIWLAVMTFSGRAVSLTQKGPGT